MNNVMDLSDDDQRCLNYFQLKNFKNIRNILEEVV